MPTWLVHGFRWPRPLIRIHIILQNLDDAAAEWTMAPGTTAALTENFHTLYPEQMSSLPSLRFIEQYNPEDMVSTEQPYAYVCDQVHEVELSVDIDEVRGKGVANEAWAALADLRDKIAPGEKIGWYIVVNGDVERAVDETVTGSMDGSQISPNSQRSSVARTVDETDSDETRRESKGLRKWFSNKARRSKSIKDLRGHTVIRTVPQSPPLPNLPRGASPSVSNPAAPLAVPVSSTYSANGKAPVRTGA